MTRPDEPIPQPGLDLPATTHLSFMERVRNYFLTGLIVTGPIALTIYITWTLVSWVDSLVRPLIPAASGTMLLVLANREAKLGLIFLDMTKTVKDIARVL